MYEEAKLAPCEASCPATPVKKSCGTKGNKPMRYRYDEEFDSADSTENRKTNYLEGRLYNIFDIKDTELQKQFYIADMDTPITPSDVKARLEAGLFELPTEEVWNTRGFYGSALGYIKWRDPSKSADKDGYDKAFKALRAERTKTEDAIQILSPDAGLAAIQTFENWTYTAQ